MPELDEQLIRDVCARIGRGAFPHQALVSCGVPAHVASRWLDHGRRMLEAHADPDDSMTCRLVSAVDIADADCQQAWISNIIKEIKGWQRYEALLEKRWPERYAKRQGPSMGAHKTDKRSLEDILDDINESKAEAESDA